MEITQKVKWKIHLVFLCDNFYPEDLWIISVKEGMAL